MYIYAASGVPLFLLPSPTPASRLFFCHNVNNFHFLHHLIISFYFSPLANGNHRNLPAQKSALWPPDAVGAWSMVVAVGARVRRKPAVAGHEPLVQSFHTFPPVAVAWLQGFTSESGSFPWCGLCGPLPQVIPMGSHGSQRFPGWKSLHL